MPVVEDLTSDEFGIQFGERTYPAVEPNEVTGTTIPEVVEDDPSELMQRTLTASILATLPFLKLSSSVTEKSTLFAEYVDSVSLLNHYREDVLQLCIAMIETTIDIDSENVSSVTVHAEILSQVLKDGEAHLSRPVNLATAEVAAFHPAEIRTQLRANLQTSVDTFVREVVNEFGLLVDRSVAGLVHWTSTNTLKYHFFRRRTAQTGHQVSVEMGAFQENQEGEHLGGFQRWKRVNERTTTTEFTCWLSHHRHVAIDAIQTSLENSKVVFPEFVQALVKQIPGWMRPSITVIDAYLIREQVSEYELFKKELTKVDFEEEFIHDFDPAICLGPFVLIGWGPREIAAEQMRQQLETGESTHPFWMVVAVACQVFCVLFARLGLFPLSALLFVTGIASLNQWVNRASVSTTLRLSEWQRQRISFGFLASLGGLQLLLTPLSFWSVLFGIVCMVAGLVMLRLDRTKLFQLIKNPGGNVHES